MNLMAIFQKAFNGRTGKMNDQDKKVAVLFDQLNEVIEDVTVDLNNKKVGLNGRSNRSGS